MQYTKIDRFMDGVDEFVRGVRGWTKRDHTQFWPIVCAHNANVLALHNGSLLSVIKINGYLGQYFKSDFVNLRKEWERFFQINAKDKTSAGFDLFWSYEYDPDGMKDFTREQRVPMKRAAERRGLDISDILDEEAELYGSICARETQLLMVVTHIDSLPKANHSKAKGDAKKDRARRIKGSNAARTGVGFRALDVTHEQHVMKVLTHLGKAGQHYDFSRLNAYDALFSMRHHLLPATTKRGWRARLTMKDTKMRSTETVSAAERARVESRLKPADWSVCMPPPIFKQMVPDGVIDLGKFVVVGERTYAPLFVDELATDPEPIENLLAMLYQRRLPVRMVFSLTANHKQANYWNRFFANAFSFMSQTNKQMNLADKGLEQWRAHDGATVGFGVAAVTWAATEVSYDQDGAAAYKVEHIQQRASDVEVLLQQWGGQQLTSVYGDGVESLFSATPGYMIPPASPLAPQTERDACTQLPLMRPAKLWDPREAIWMRTSDGILTPYTPMSSRQSSMIKIILGSMGYGKSADISDTIFYCANNPNLAEMPYIRGIDFGASSSGVIDIIRSSLPPEQRHQAVFEDFDNDGRIVKNLMDTRPGCRYPLADHRAFLKNVFMLLCEDLVKEAGASAIAPIIAAGIDRAYYSCDARNPGSTFKRYLSALMGPDVQAAVDRAEVVLDEHSTYWEVVDALIERSLDTNDESLMHAARLVQRHAVPDGADLVAAVAALESQFKDAPELNGIPLVRAITNSLTNAFQMFKCFNGITNTDISESRVCVYDMSSVFGRGVGPLADWERAVYFAVALRLLTEDLFIKAIETGEELREHQQKLGISDRMLKWYASYLERQDQISKLFWADELHRLGVVEGALSILESLALEARKYVVGLMLGTQLPQHIPAALLQLATSVFMYGAGQSSENAIVLQNLFDLSDDERQIVLDITKPDPRKGAEVFVIHKVDSGTQRLKLHSNIGRIKLWAYATGGNERALRRYLYEKGPSTRWARKALADNVSDLHQTLAYRREQPGNEHKPEADLVRELAKDLLEGKAVKRSA